MQLAVVRGASANMYVLLLVNDFAILRPHVTTLKMFLKLLNVRLKLLVLHRKLRELHLELGPFGVALGNDSNTF